MRTIQEILISADEAETPKELLSCYAEIKKNLRKYDLVHLRFAVRYLNK